jgi:RNA polymerase sigma-70 factor, ECF subfamily
MKGKALRHGAQVDLWYERGRAAYPDLLLDQETFAAHVARAWRASDGADPVFVEDLFLAAACATHIESAARVFRDRYGRTIRRGLAGSTPTSADRDDLEQRIYEQLLVGSPSAPPQIQSYAGQAPLAAWLSVVAQRAGLMALRADGSRARARDAAAREKLAGAVCGIGGESAMIKKQARPLVKEALARAWAELPARDRIVFHLHVVGGAGLERLGKMYGVSPSTICRWVARARREILGKTRECLSDELRLTPAESDSLMALVASQLDVSAGDLPPPTAGR